MKEVTVFTNAHAEDIAFGGAGEIANELAKKLTQDVYERMEVGRELGDDMYEIFITVKFISDAPIRGRNKGVPDKDIQVCANCKWYGETEKEWDQNECPMSMIGDENKEYCWKWEK